MAAAPDASDGRHAGGIGGAARWSLVLVAVAAIIVCRTPEVFVRPSLEAEDGTFVFPYYYAHRDLAGLARFQAGYIPLVLNLIAFISVRLPTRLIPYGFALLPLLISLVAGTWLFRATFRDWLGGDEIRAFICILFALAPIAQYHVYANATYSIWSCLLLLVLLSVTPPPERTWASVLAWLATNVLVWSNPASILVSPLVAIRAARERGRRALHLLTLVNIAVYSSLGVEKGGIFLGLTWFESLEKLLMSIVWTFVLVAATSFRTAFGSPAYAWVESGHWIPAALWFALVAVGTGLVIRRGRVRWEVMAVLAYTIVGFTFLSLLGRGPSTLFPLNSASRYVYLPSLAFIALFVLLIEHLVVSKWPHRRVAIFGAVAMFYFLLNAQLGLFVGGAERRVQTAEQPRVYVQSGVENGRIVRDYFAELARIERATGSREGIYLKTDKKDDWPIVVDTRAPTAR